MTLDRLRNLGFVLAFLLLGVMLFSLYGAFRSAIESGNWVAFLGGIVMGAVYGRAPGGHHARAGSSPDRLGQGHHQRQHALPVRWPASSLWVLVMGFLLEHVAARHPGGWPRAHRHVRGHLHLHGLHLVRHRGVTAVPPRATAVGRPGDRSGARGVRAHPVAHRHLLDRRAAADGRPDQQPSCRPSRVSCRRRLASQRAPQVAGPSPFARWGMMGA